MMPADLLSYGICEKLMEMLWEEDPVGIRLGMEEARRQRHLYPRDAPDPFPSNMVDGCATVMA